jgi:hypothetical protein
VRTTGSQFHGATTLWGFIDRATPFFAPQSLAPDNVYALNLKDILLADAALDRPALPRTKIPDRDGFTAGHGFMRRDGRPDLRNVARMKECATDEDSARTDEAPLR